MASNPFVRTENATGVFENLPLVTAKVMIGSQQWSINAVENQDAITDLVETLEHMPYGFLIWESSVGLARHLEAHPEIVAGKRVLEIGCGVGLPGLVARSLGASVTQTDHQPGVLVLARQNALANSVEGVEQFIADWRDWKVKEKFDVLIGADILYERNMHYHLERVFTRSIVRGGTLLLADPGRPQAIEFMAGLEKVGWFIDMQTINVRLDHEGPDAKKVEVAIMTALLDY